MAFDLFPLLLLSHPIHEAVRNEDHLLTQRMVKENRSLVFVTNYDGHTPLHIAASKEHGVYCAQTLFNYGAEVDVTDPKGETPLHIAASLGRDHMIRTLANHHANLNAPNASGHVPLHKAVEAELVGTARLLLLRGANIAARTPSGMTALHYAAQHNLAPIIAMLTQLEAPMDLVDTNGDTPMSLAEKAAMPGGAGSKALLLMKHYEEHLEKKAYHKRLRDEL